MGQEPRRNNEEPMKMGITDMDSSEHLSDIQDEKRINTPCQNYEYGLIPTSTSVF